MNKAVLFSSASDRWATPREVYAALDSEFAFNLDPCPLDGNCDGLSPLFCQWQGRRVFCNPPYGRGVGKWLSRAPEALNSLYSRALTGKESAEKNYVTPYRAHCLRPAAISVSDLKRELGLVNTPIGESFMTRIEKDGWTVEGKTEDELVIGIVAEWLLPFGQLLLNPSSN